MIKHFIFTITNGRSGQETLYNIIKSNSINCLTNFEHPNFKPYFSNILGDIERKIRRKFLQTNELLGRGKVLKAFEKNNIDYIEKIAKVKLNLFEKEAEKHKVDIYFDISKYFIRGLHLGFCNLLNEYSLVFLIRDPLMNMNRFINRKKTLLLHNNLPSSDKNLLTMDSGNFDKGEYYLWSWAEVYLRYQQMRKSAKVRSSIVLNTSDLNNKEKVINFFKEININFKPIKYIKKYNTNEENNYLKTSIKPEDLNLLEKFILKLPSNQVSLKKILQQSYYDNIR